MMLALILAALLVSIGAAVAAKRGTASVSRALAAHCTRYEPPTQADVYCGDGGQFSGPDSGTYVATSGYALRDDNVISIDLYAAPIELAYLDSSSNVYDFNSSTGTYLFESRGSGSNYWKSACGWDTSSGGTPWGYCTTDWHD